MKGIPLPCSRLYGKDGEGCFSLAADADDGVVRPVEDDNEVVPALGQDAFFVEDGVFAAVDGGGDAFCRGVAGDVDFHLPGEVFAGVCIREGEGGGFHGGGVVQSVSVCVGGVVVDDFQVAGAVSRGDEEEAVAVLTVRQGAGGGATDGVRAWRISSVVFCPTVSCVSFSSIIGDSAFDTRALRIPGERRNKSRKTELVFHQQTRC